MGALLCPRDDGEHVGEFSGGLHKGHQKFSGGAVAANAGQHERLLKMSARAKRVGKQSRAFQKPKLCGAFKRLVEAVGVCDVGKEQSHALLMAMPGSELQWTCRGLVFRLGPVDNKKAEEARVAFLRRDDGRVAERISWVGAEGNKACAGKRRKVKNEHHGGLAQSRGGCGSFEAGGGAASAMAPCSTRRSTSVEMSAVAERRPRARASERAACDCSTGSSESF